MGIREKLANIICPGIIRERGLWKDIASAMSRRGNKYHDILVLVSAHCSSVKGGTAKKVARMIDEELGK